MAIGRSARANPRTGEASKAVNDCAASQQRWTSERRSATEGCADTMSAVYEVRLGRGNGRRKRQGEGKGAIG